MGKVRVKIQSDGVVMATAMGDVYGGRTGDHSVRATFDLTPGSAVSSDGLHVDFDSANEDPVETYFACITTCSLDDGDCITICTEQLRESH